MLFPCPWLDPEKTAATRLAVAQWAIERVGVMEMPLGSNRSGLIDGWNTAAGAPIASSYCASFAFSGWKENGATPLGNAACQTWHANAHAAGRLIATPDIGDIALFDFSTQAGWADHAGIVVRVDPAVITIEANTNDNGSREGDGVYMHKRGTAQLIGYVSLGL